jgi:hypothetical protein
MHRHATHRDIIAQMLAPFGQRDIKRLGSGHRIIEKQLVKIAHAIEQQCLGILGFDLQILRHHGRHG